MPTYQSINESYLTMTLHILLIKLFFSTEEETKPGKKIIQETKKNASERKKKKHKNFKKIFTTKGK